MQTIQVEVLNAEEEAAKHVLVLAANEEKERERIIAANLASGHPVPSEGFHMFVSTARGIPRRSRAGVTFGPDRLQLVVVKDAKDPGQIPAGSIPITVTQAHAIIHDNGLNVNARAATEVEAAALRTILASRDGEIEKLKAENQRLTREARQAAVDDPNGGPARLRAAKAAVKSDPDGFGGGK